MSAIFRIGLGKDLHRLVEGRRFLLGGVQLPSKVGEDGHSDGDVLCHAISDALLGAAGLADIGELFPPGDKQWKDADSLELLRRAYALVQEKGWRVVNIDCVIVCERPKILPFRERVQSSLSRALDIDPDKIFVKAKTNERMDSVGAGLAVEATAICLLEKPAATPSGETA